MCVYPSCTKPVKGHARCKAHEALCAEAGRRLSDHWKLSIEGRAFVGIPRADILSSFGNDDHVQLELAYFF